MANENKIPTIDELYDEYMLESELDIMLPVTCKEMAIEFAKLHVKAALQAAAEKAKLTNNNPHNLDNELYYDSYTEDDYPYVTWKVSKTSILNSYRENLIQ